jgi:hypothetical protein
VFTKNNFFNLKISFLLLVIAVVFAFPNSSFAKTESAVNNYVVKLTSNDLSSLNLYATDIKPEFDFTSDSSFQNIYNFKSSLSLAELTGKLGQNAEYVEIDPTISADAKDVIKLPNDPGFSNSYSNDDKQWGLSKAGFVKAWKRTTGLTQTTVAVIDTGIDGTHVDFSKTHFVAGYNFVDDKNILAGSNSDDNGHGTLVAGVIGATTNNKKGIAGADWNVSLMAVKALNAQGSGSASNIAEAIVWATDHDADVINLSLGGFKLTHTQTLADSISYAYENNVVVVAAAGNDVAITGGNLDEKPVFPICNDNGKNMIIGVTATDNRDQKPDFANYGKACVDVSAPGKRILSLINFDPATKLESPDSYAYASGTSMAVPFVSAQAALLKSFSPRLNNKQICDSIISTTDNIDKFNLSQCNGGSCAGLIGSGRINVYNSIQKSQSTIVDGDVVQVEGQSDLYLINGGQRQLISSFVKNQRFANVVPRIIKQSTLQTIPLGTMAMPTDGTLVKAESNPAVYYIKDGLRLPVTGRVFSLHSFKFSDVVNLPDSEVNSWVLGSLLTPPESSLLRSKNNTTLYWVSNGSIHAINYNFYLQRGLGSFPVIYMTDSEIKEFPVGEPYIL